jgi:hypothetical protein
MREISEGIKSRVRFNAVVETGFPGFRDKSKAERDGLRECGRTYPYVRKGAEQASLSRQDVRRGGRLANFVVSRVKHDFASFWAVFPKVGASFSKDFAFFHQTGDDFAKPGSLEPPGPRDAAGQAGCFSR